MVSPNGVVPLRGARSLRVVYDTFTYALELPDGETVSLAGYRRGPGCPISVEIEVEGAWAEWSEESPTDEERGDPNADPPVPGTLTGHRYIAKLMRAERLLRRNLLCAVLPGLSPEMADVLAADAGPWEDILVELGWWSRSTEQAAEGEVLAGGQTESPTGAPASPASASPTPAETP